MDCSLGYLLKADYDICLRDINQADAERRKNFFYREVFHGEVLGNTAHRLAFDFYKRKLVLGKSETIVKQGEKSKFITVIRSGQVCIHREELEPISDTSQEFAGDKPALMSTEMRKKRYITCLAGPGELFGEEGFFPNPIPDYTVQVISQTAVVLQVTYECLRSYFGQDIFLPEFLKKLFINRRKRRETQMKLIRKLGKSTTVLDASRHDFELPDGCILGGLREAEIVQDHRNGFLKRFRMRAFDQRMMSNFPDLKIGEVEIINDLKAKLDGLPEERQPKSLEVTAANGERVVLNHKELVALKDVNLSDHHPGVSMLEHLNQQARQTQSFSPAKSQSGASALEVNFRGSTRKKIQPKGKLAVVVTDQVSYHDKY